MTNQAGPSNQPSRAQAQAAARTEDGGRDADRLRPNASKPPIKPCKCFAIKKGRNLIVCIDGTSNQFGINNTNVVELYSLIEALDDEGREQLTYYNSGIGTYAEPSWKSLSYIKQVVYHKVDMAIAWNLERIVISAYVWLADQYQPGDRIFLFGFSRGAYQVRALAAMMDKVGLIKKGNQDQVPFAYQLYAACGEEKKQTSKSKPSATQMAEHFRKSFSRLVNIHFIGAWDTVSSVGTVRDKTLPGTTDGMHQACYFRHAMALDERRVKFLPEYAYGGTSLPPVEQVGHPAPDVAQQRANESNRLETAEQTSETTDTTSRRIHTKEVWFAGTHSDIGGGNVENPTMDRTRPPLRWMAFEAAAAGLRLRTIDRDLKPGEQIEVHESLGGVWWILELLPIKRLSYKAKDGSAGSTRVPHCGVGRLIQPGQRVHSSVILSPAGKYIPKARRHDVPKKERTSWWSGLRNPTEAAEKPDPSQIEYDFYDSVQTLVEKYNIPSCTLDERHNLLVEMRPFTSSAEGRLALWQAEAPDAILSMIRGLQAHSIQVAMEILQKVAVEGSPKNFGFRATRRSQLSTILEGTNIGNQKIARTILQGFTDECLVLPGHDSVACAECLVLPGHDWAVSSVAFSPDGTHVASGSYDGTIRIWDAQTGKTVGEPLRGHTHRARSVAFSPDGTRIVSGSIDNTIRIWDAGTREPVGEPLEGHTDRVTSVAFSPDGKVIASGSDDFTVRLWDVESYVDAAKTGETH